jgi:hypothetical protein
MLRCKIFGFAFSLVPLKKWQNFLIGFHMEKCPKCQNLLISREDVQGITIHENHFEDTDSIWDGFEQKVREAKTGRQHVLSPRWSWAYGIAVVLILGAAAIWFALSPQFRKNQVEESLNGHFRINYMRIENKPAQAYFFQPQDSHMIIVWAQKNTSGE